MAQIFYFSKASRIQPFHTTFCYRGINGLWSLGFALETIFGIICFSQKQNQIGLFLHFQVKNTLFFQL